jgi:hypothetical protein
LAARHGRTLLLEEVELEDAALPIGSVAMRVSCDGVFLGEGRPAPNRDIAQRFAFHAGMAGWYANIGVLTRQVASKVQPTTGIEIGVYERGKGMGRKHGRDVASGIGGGMGKRPCLTSQTTEAPEEGQLNFMS